METKETNEIIYSKNVLSFLAVSVEFCHFLERDAEVLRNEWVSKILRILPLIYAKGLTLPEVDLIHEELPPTFVREEDYSRVANRVSAIMGDEDTYLDVFMDEMKYSDRPISAFVSENVADLYQDIRNFVSVYQFELTNQMQDALYICRENFFLYWGQKLVNVLRPLHALMCRDDEIDSGEEMENLNMEELWD